MSILPIIWMLVLVIYALVAFRHLWYGLKKPAVSNSSPSISVLVPFRNEAANLPKLLDALKKQSFEQFDLILIDDHSQDNSVQIIKKIYPQAAILSSDGQGKKSALQTGINTETSEWIVTIDADCIPSPSWLKALSEQMTEDTHMVCGPVTIQPQGIPGVMQHLEFAGIMLYTAGSIKGRFPYVCNGANLAFRRASYHQVGGYEHGKQHASGDDVFLMESLTEQFGSESISFSDKALVETAPVKDLPSFFQQRIRWASKVGSYKSPRAKYIGALLLTAQLMQFGFFLLPLWLVAKFTVDVLFQYVALKKFGSRRWIFLFPIFFLIYPCYTLFIGLGSLFIKPKWKDRKIA